MKIHGAAADSLEPRTFKLIKIPRHRGGPRVRSLRLLACSSRRSSNRFCVNLGIGLSNGMSLIFGRGNPQALVPPTTPLPSTYILPLSGVELCDVFFEAYPESGSEAVSTIVELDRGVASRGDPVTVKAATASASWEESVSDVGIGEVMVVSPPRTSRVDVKLIVHLATGLRHTTDCRFADYYVSIRDAVGCSAEHRGV